MAIKYGQQGLDSQLAANRYFDVTETIFLKRPDESPFTALMVALGKSRTGDSRFSWFNKDIRPQATTAAVISALASTSLQVVDASLFLVGDLIRVYAVTTGILTAPVHRVTAVNTGTNVLTIVRAIVGADVAIAVGDTILRIGNAHAEGSAIPPSSVQELTEYFNYTQIFRHSSDYTRSFFESNKFHAGNLQKELQTRREEKRREHKREIEAAMFWGIRGIESSGTANARRTMSGIYDWLAISAAGGVDNTQAVAGAGALTYATFTGFLASKAFSYGGEEKWAFASRETVEILNRLVSGAVRIGNLETVYGQNVTRFETTSGILNIVRHDLMRFGASGTDLIVVDPDHMELRFLGDSMSRFMTDVGLKSNDSTQDEWLTECGLQVAVPESLAKLSNIVSAA